HFNKQLMHGGTLLVAGGREGEEERVEGGGWLFDCGSGERWDCGGWLRGGAGGDGVRWWKLMIEEKKEWREGEGVTCERVLPEVRFSSLGAGGCATGKRQ
ncbi:unnamed protein product, partial [Ilex paraguariensis]